MNSLEPFYFGEPGKQLFGCCHHPESGRIRNCGVLLCYPMGHEYIQFHRVFKQLASLLADVGFPVLRFDFYGCGDSTGDCGEGRIAQWLADISAAVGEIRSRCPVLTVCLVGLRLGGALSMIAGAERGDIDGIVLWDPIVAGQAYIEELKTLHRRMLQQAHVKPASDERHLEILGFSITDHIRMDFEHIDLLAIKHKPANHMLVVESHESSGQPPLMAHLQSLSAEVTHRHLSSPQFWTWIEDFSHILVPNDILRSVVGWISEVYQ